MMHHLYLYALFLFVSSSTFASVQTVHQMGDNYQLTPPWDAQVQSELRFAQEAEAPTSGDIDAEDEEFITPKQKKKMKSFWNKYFALKANDALVAEVRNNKWAFFAGGCLSCVGGTVWLPMLIIDEKPPANYMKDGLIAWGAHFVFQMSMNAVTAVLLSISLPSPTALVACADMLWWLPVNAMNIWDEGRKNKMAQIRLENEFLTSMVPVKNQRSVVMAY